MWLGNEQVKNLKGKDLVRDALDIAMFGRMVATKTYLNVDAAVQVAHAISVGELRRSLTTSRRSTTVPLNTMQVRP
jgi:hypothetical protein